MTTNNDTLPPSLDEEISSTEIFYKSWKFLVIAAGAVVVFLILSLFLVFGGILYRTVLVVVFTSYFPLSYLSYLQSRSKTHEQRIIDDNQLLGLTTESELRSIYSQIYNPQQFVIYLILAVLATLLGFGLYNRSVIEGLDGFITPEDAQLMFYSFLGAYIFSVYYVYRRYVTLDLQPSIYLYITARMFTVQAVALVATQVLQTDTSLSYTLVPIIAFIIGYFPDTGIRWLTSLASRYLGKALDRDEQPLSAVDGISLWHETRLRESGIDNVQNLAAADVRELILNSRFSTQQLMHWIDQAILMTNLPQKYPQLREHGICTISALYRILEQSTVPERLNLPQPVEVNGKTLALTTADLWSVYYAADSGPNLHYVTQYWQALKRLRKTVVQQNLVKLLKEESVQASTGELLDDVLAAQLDQIIDNFKLSPENLEEVYQNSVTRLISLGGVYIKRRQYMDAVRVYTRAISLDPENVGAFRERGSGWAMQDKYDLAFKDFERAKELAHLVEDADALNAVTLNSMGSAYFRKLEFAQAIESYQEAIKLNPKYSSAFYNLGMVYLRQGNRQQSLINFNQAIQCAPERFEAYLERGGIYIAQEKFNRAIEDFSSAIHYNRGNARAYHSRGIAYMHASQFDRALYDFDTAIDIAPDQAIFYLDRARVYRKLNYRENTIADCTNVITHATINHERDGVLAAAYRLRAQIYEQSGRLTDAISDIEHYLEYDPPEKDKAKANDRKESLQARLRENLQLA